LLAVVVPAGVGAQERRTATPEETLVARYTPILLLKEQEKACSNAGEPYTAAPVGLVLDNPAVRLRDNTRGQPVLITAPTAADLGHEGAATYLDFPGNPLRPDCSYERWARQRMKAAGLVPTTYAHIAREKDRDGFAIQYWFFYAFNDFNNKHEGDWEMIQVVFDVNTVEEALETEPVEVGFAQHGGGERASWDDGKLDLDGTHPLVHVSRGSHASQYDSAVYLGWGENDTGFGCDITTGPSKEVPLTAVLVPTDPDPAGPFGWATFGGRWGQHETWEFNGPKSPNLTGKWARPLSWQDNLRPSSFAVPLGGTLGPAPTKAFCQVSAASADLFRTWAQEPWQAVLYALLVILVPIVLIVISWQTLSAALWLYVRHLFVFVPAAIAVLAIGLLFNIIDALGQFIFNIGPLADYPVILNSFNLAAIIGQIVVSLVIVAPAAIYGVMEVRDGRRPGSQDLVDWELRHLSTTLRALVRPWVVIGLLTLVPAGIFLAIYRAVQRLFIPQLVLINETAPVAARAESVRFVSGRWWRTAALTAILLILVAIPSPLIGILLLVFSARSISFINIGSSLVYALVVPYLFAATTLYFLEHRRDGPDPGIARDEMGLGIPRAFDEAG
jgi:hypothetical protein